jgi:hypothetical protein
VTKKTAIGLNSFLLKEKPLTFFQVRDLFFADGDLLSKIIGRGKVPSASVLSIV